MARNRLWYPPEDQPPLLDWWQPLLRLSRELREADAPWDVFIDDFELRGRVVRTSAASVWVYRHRTAGAELYVDDHGRTYSFTPTPNAASAGRFKLCDSWSAASRAGLPYTPPRSHELYGGGVDYDEDDDYGPSGPSCAELSARYGTPSPPQPAPGRRRGHLSLVHG